ncbi:MAG TPA: SAM-dependent chlorinase/fluorinase [Thermoanaerobaculia bacterium]|nr:SAM-dependent chlorinase/fluorinase [Thermoanaerobaculia bacterium]
MAIALLTDFGTRDPYVAAMKGVIAARCEAALFDLTHEIEAFDVFEAAWFLRAITPYWRDTVFVCVVDPGVGTSRRILCVERDTNVFLAPDNGLLTFIDGVARSVKNETLFLPAGSTTFHGRDRFAPVAAAIANGLALDELGPRVDDRVRLDYEPPSYGDDVVRGTIVAIDRFGNCVTDIERARVPFDAFAIGGVDRLEANYADAGEEPFLIVGSTGCIEISMRNASAARRLQLSRRNRVELCRKAAPREKSSRP